MSLLQITGLRVGFDTEDGEVLAVRDLSLRLERGEILALVRRIGLRQVRHRHVGPPPPARRHHAAVRLDHAERARAHRPDRARTARDPRQGRLDGLPGADDLAEPLVHRRLPDRRGPAPPREPVAYGGASPRDRAAGAGRHPGARAARQGVPPPAVGRHAPAGDDRDRGGVLASGPDRRRADHRARRDDPGRRTRRLPRPARPARHRDHPDHPRPRRRRRHRRPRGRHVRRARRRGGTGDRAVRPAAPPVHRGAHARAALCRGDRSRRAATARGDPRAGAAALRRPATSAPSTRAVPVPRPTAGPSGPRSASTAPGTWRRASIPFPPRRRRPREAAHERTRPAGRRPGQALPRARAGGARGRRGLAVDRAR